MNYWILDPQGRKNKKWLKWIQNEVSIAESWKNLENFETYKKSRSKVFPIGENNEKSIVQLNQPTHSNNRIYREDGISPTLNTAQGGNRQPKIAKTVRSGGRASPHGAKQNWDSYEFEGKIRRLTPTECERLQGFPDQWTNNVSDTQRYKTLGNAVTVNVVQRVVHDLFFTPNGNVV